ncbi:hypothetical protein [Bacillus sp. AK031]
MNSIKLPTILSGPIIRRADSNQVCIWIALSEPLQVKGRIYTVHQPPDAEACEYETIDCSSETDSIHAGKQLFVHLIKLTPHAGALPLETLIGYNLIFENENSSFDLAAFDLLSPHHSSSIVYGNLEYPTFYLSDRSSSFLYGSCRKLHGEGADTLAEADEALSSSFDTSGRPAALFLMGDQIYADDVADMVFPLILKLSRQLIGKEETLGDIEPNLKEKDFQKRIQQINGRQYITEQFCSFTSNKADNHLLSIGEYAAMYLLSWSPELWKLAQDENLLPSFEEALEDDKIHFSFNHQEMHKKEFELELRLLKERYNKQSTELSSFQETLSAARRVLANTPTYMIFDDHDITDDWNLTKTWKSRVHDSALGRHVISNGLASYWLFQGWGNAPATYEYFKKPMQEYLDVYKPASSSHSDWMESLWAFSSWHFIAPTAPAALFLDTRTQREYFDTPQPVKIGRKIDEEKVSPNLIGAETWDTLYQVLLTTSWKAGDPLVIISPTPLYGIGLIENFLQKFILPLRSLGVPVQQSFDLEAWKYNAKGFSEFLCRIADWSPSDCIVLSGDVHSASAVKSAVGLPDGRSFTIHQYTSSPIKNMSYSSIAGNLMKLLIMLNARQRTNRTLYRYCTKEHDMITSHDAGEIPGEYEWKETIDYLKVKDSSIFETKNNIGLFTYTSKQLENTLLMQSGTHNYTTEEELD